MLTRKHWGELRVTETDAERYRVQAEECRHLATAALNPLDKEAWLKLAAEWEKLADGAQREK